jgi:predicted amidohydrolase YtcJ
MFVLHNANVHTLDRANPLASAIVIDAERILAVGNEALVAECDPKDSQDMGGRVILPGLTDAHIHLQEYSLSLQILNCELDKMEGIVHLVKKAIRGVLPGEWIRGHGWNQNSWGGNWPTAAELEQVAPENPVYLTAKSLHAAWVNQTALRIAEINSSTQDTTNGKIQRDVVGNPTGILFENAMKLVEDVIPETTPEKLAKNLQQVISKLWRMGLTGAHDFDKRTCFQALQLLNEQGGLKFRVVKSIPFEMSSNASDLGLRSGFGNDFLRIGSVKLFADGALGSHTGAFFEPYEDDPQNLGILLLNKDQIFESGYQLVRNGLSLAVHAIGDRAVHEVLDGFALLRTFEREQNLPPLRHRIEHVQTINSADVDRLGKLGIIASMQPCHATSDSQMADNLLANRAGFSYAWRMLLDHGSNLAFGSDAPVENPNPFWGLHAAVTRCKRDSSIKLESWHPEQCLTVPEALDCFTTGPAFIAGMEDQLGRISPGYLADLIVVDEDPFACAPEELFHIQPIATMVNGEWVWKL